MNFGTGREKLFSKEKAVRRQCDVKVLLSTSNSAFQKTAARGLVRGDRYLRMV